MTSALLATALADDEPWRSISLEDGSAASAPTTESCDAEGRADDRTRCFNTYVLILILFLTVQFGHGSNIGVAVTLPGDSKAQNLGLGSCVMIGVCLGLPLTPWACRTFGSFRVCVVCLLIDFLVVLLMLWPEITINQIYAVRILVGFFEAPLLPYLQEWLARFGKHAWNVWNTVLHAMVPVGENLGYCIAQELHVLHVPWQWAFAGQAVVLFACGAMLWFYSGRRYIDITPGRTQSFEGTSPCCDEATGSGGENSASTSASGKAREEEYSTPGVEYPVTERWAVFWATNCGLASQLGFLSGFKYVIPFYVEEHAISNPHVVIFMFSSIALAGPAIGGALAMSGKVIRPDQWSLHKRTLLFLTGTASVAAVFAMLLHFVPTFFFWPTLFATFVSAGGVYPAAQGIINIALTESRVIEASVYQVQCNNLLFAMPMPFAIGTSIDTFGVDPSFRMITFIQVLTAFGFFCAFIVAVLTQERSTWNRLMPAPREMDPLEGSCLIGDGDQEAAME